ncbi:3-methylornithyl-N6-L-lysine dehydrogenase PylD [Sporomusa sp.]|uniref:3-methylornithyl-N6-L-lysine dehydrogenase PylD n=1 Tax=Sporomusa sp. TaxID=2078658 RepID=UPI002B78A847|nr:3-methylornithyl-N6-L-lysine dehydrogenase PylD [Sporomusa sp.]HWR41670.1 3-methylornithyl-N6-L-lysine dehydrogenase PylD [Sporomusa sp.]
MTRLRESDINRIVYQMEQYNQELLSKTGHTLSEIAAHAVGIKCMDGAKARDQGPIAVIPMTCGQGVIGGFSETVAGILTFLGIQAFVTNSSDAKGFAEALERKAEILFMADDDRFIAAYLKTGRYSDNSQATGKGYVAALDYMTGGIKDQSVLILGAGPVGTAAAFSVLNFGGKVHVYDKNDQASAKLAKDVLTCCGQGIHIEKNLDSALKGHRIIVDACPEAEFITQDHLYFDSYVAAPGVPLGIHAKALERIKTRLIHDPLQLGVATMLYDIMTKES